MRKFSSTADIKVQKTIIEQVLGQDEAVKIMKKAAGQRRHVLLIGEPGTGKSMLGLALAEMLPKEKLKDILSFPNPNDENTPLIRELPAGQGRDFVNRAKLQSMSLFRNQNIIMFILLIIAMITPWWARSHYQSDIMFAAFFLGGMLFLVAFLIFINVGKRMAAPRVQVPKVIVDNFKKKTSPFYDATGAHAGALLGDVLHDPFQCFIDSKIYIKECISEPYNLQNMRNILDKTFVKHKKHIIRSEKGYEAIFLGKNELFILGESNGSIAPVEVLSCNRQEYEGEMIKLLTSANKEVIVTPEHKISVNRNGKIAYLEAKHLKKGDEIISKAEDIIIDEQDIINTYDERQQEQCRLYCQYLNTKKKNPSWGYKRIARAMGQPIGKTRWWHAKRHVPVPMQTAYWLKRRGLLPLKADNPRLSIIAKVLGATFGDGGIFENLNGVFLSSSEIEAVREFGRDIEKTFKLKKGANSRIIEGGEKGHSWCYHNSNRNIIRFLLALGAPKGNKTKLELQIPNWVYLLDRYADEFFGSFLGGEIGVPKVHKQRNRLQTLDVAITGPERLDENRMNFLNQLKVYLDSKGIRSTSLVKQKTSNKSLCCYRLLLSIKFDNVVNFAKSIKINYCSYKKKKLFNAINEFKLLKKSKYEEMINRGYGAETVMKLLNLTPDSLYLVLNGEKIES